MMFIWVTVSSGTVIFLHGKPQGTGKEPRKMCEKGFQCRSGETVIG